MSLRTNFKDDVFSGKRKYTMTNNQDGSVSFTDVTQYVQEGDTYGAAQINETNDVVNKIDAHAFRNTDSAETSIADNDYFPFYDTSASARKKTLWSNIKTVLTNVFAIKVHNSSSASAYGAGNASYFGHVKLSDAYATSAGGASSSIAASSLAVNNAYKAAKALSDANTTKITANSNKITTIEGELTANGSRIYMDYKNGKYGYNTNANRGADTFHPFSDYSSVGLGMAVMQIPGWGLPSSATQNLPAGTYNIGIACDANSPSVYAHDNTHNVDLFYAHAPSDDPDGDWGTMGSFTLSSDASVTLSVGGTHFYCCAAIWK